MTGRVLMGWLRLVGSIKLQVSFAEYGLFLQGSFAKETYNFIDPNNQSHPIAASQVPTRQQGYMSHVTHMNESGHIYQ